MDKALKQCLGIDVSKASLSLSYGILYSNLKKEFIGCPDIMNDQSGFNSLKIWLGKMVEDKECFYVIMEATGVYHQRVCHFLYDLGYKVCVMQSGRVKRYAQSLDQRSKTDSLDSRMLSMLGLERELRLWEPPSKELQQLKLLSRERSSLLKDKTTEINRQSAVESSNYYCKSAHKRHLKRLQLINEQIRTIEQEMRALVKEDAKLQARIGYLESIPGVSFISAATVVGETLGFESISNGKQLASYAGYDVVLKESGRFKGKTKISKKGNSHIRAVLHMPSMTCVRCNPTLRPFYKRIKPNKAKPMVALVAVQRKLLVLMYTLWKNEENYDEEFEKKKQQGLKVPAARDNSQINLNAS
ncbi:IS110 family transposase [Mangrovimonas futianensis]|uniref:IS110 family transposase n=1 Tax=Mangrovimonas futianensis TaxID=2895523 RepID=UPI001E5AC6BD|nr:transposase [Mangrovimonas futianensis]MCF1423267.1 transposase [Mangrovimonas futianensis]